MALQKLGVLTEQRVGDKVVARYYVIPPPILPEDFSKISTDKVDKYLTKLLSYNGDGLENILEKSLANLFTVNKGTINGTIERETLEYRITTFRRKSSNLYNSNFFAVVQALEEMNKSKIQLIQALENFKFSVNSFYVKRNT
jgi:hypothetical protein